MFFSFVMLLLILSIFLFTSLLPKGTTLASSLSFFVLLFTIYDRLVNFIKRRPFFGVPLTFHACLFSSLFFFPPSLPIL